MKLDGLDHPKTLDLSARLDISLPQTIGHLELLWAFVAQKTPQGNIGKWPDGTIARSAHWTGDPTTFVNALDDAGFLDACNEHRYIVHDWQEHCPRWVVAKLKKIGESFYSADYSADCSSDSRADSLRARSPSLAKPSQAKPNGRARTRATQLPKNFNPDDTCRKKAETLGIRLETELEKFTNHAQSKGRTAKDWQAAFRNWLIKASEFQADGKNPEEPLWQDAI